MFKKSITGKFMKRLVVIVALCLLAMLSATVQSQTPVQLTVWNPGVVNFPEVTFNLRAVDNNGVIIDGLTVDMLTIGDSVPQSIGLTQTQSSMTTVFVIDTSAVSDPERDIYRDVLNNFANRIYQQGDVVKIYTTAGNAAIDITTQSDLINFANNLSFSNFASDNSYNRAIDQASNALIEAAQDGSPRQMILLATYLPGGTISPPRQGVAVYGMHLHRGRGNFSRDVQALTNAGFVAIESTNSATASEFLLTLNEQRTYYSVTYTSQQAAQGVRSVPVTLTIGGTSASTTLSYQRDVLPPEIEIISSESNFNIIRNASVSDEVTPTGNYGLSFDHPAETITASVSFPDDLVRPLQSATLYIDGISQGERTVALDPNTGNFTLTWDVSDYVETVSPSLSVEITDSFGQTVRSVDRPATISVSLPDIDTGVPLSDCYVNGELINRPDCIVADNSGIAIGTIVILIIAVIAVSGLAIWQRRNLGRAVGKVTEVFGDFSDTLGASAVDGIKKTQVFLEDVFGRTTQTEQTNMYGEPHGYAGSPNTVTNVESTNIFHEESPMAVNQDTRTQVEMDPVPGAAAMPLAPVRSSGSYARLVVKEGFPGRDEIIMHTVYMGIGRNEAHGVDVVIPKQSISRMHCSIKYDHNMQTFYLEDIGSANGTYINGNRIAQRDPQMLNRGDIITLAKQDKVVFEFIPTVDEATRPATGNLRRFNNNYTLVEETDSDNEPGRTEEGVLDPAAGVQHDDADVNRVPPRSSMMPDIEYDKDDENWIN